MFHSALSFFLSNKPAKSLLCGEISAHCCFFTIFFGNNLVQNETEKKRNNITLIDDHYMHYARARFIIAQMMPLRSG